jgi:hypothetical protein
MLPIAACTFGFCLGLRFNVFVLVPATLISIAFFAAFCYLSGTPSIQVALMGCRTIFLCQAGYMLGLMAREPIAQLLAGLKLRQFGRV